MTLTALASISTPLSGSALVRELDGKEEKGLIQSPHQRLTKKNRRERKYLSLSREIKVKSEMDGEPRRALVACLDSDVIPDELLELIWGR